jgi:hypothetical protein
VVRRFCCQPQEFFCCLIGEGKEKIARSNATWLTYRWLRSRPQFLFSSFVRGLGLLVRGCKDFEELYILSRLTY